MEFGVDNKTSENSIIWANAEENISRENFRRQLASNPPPASHLTDS